MYIHVGHTIAGYLYVHLYVCPFKNFCVTRVTRVCLASSVSSSLLHFSFLLSCLGVCPHAGGRSSRSVGFVDQGDNGDDVDDIGDAEDFYSYRGGRDSSLPPYSPGYPSSSQRRVKGEVYDMLRDLRLKCETASTRLTTLADGLYPHITNPNLREWEYSTIPKVREADLRLEPERLEITDLDI